MQTTDTFIGNQECKIDLFYNGVNKFFLELENSSFAFCGNKDQIICTGLWGRLEQQDYKACACVLSCDSPSYDKNTFRLHNTEQLTRTAKRDEKEWPDSNKDAKQIGTNNKIQVPNKIINSPGTQHKENEKNGVQIPVLTYYIFTD